MTTLRAEPVRVMLVDDHEAIRAGIRAEIEKHNDIEVVAETANGEEAILIAEELRPDVIILDLHLQGQGREMSGIEVASVLHSSNSLIPILALSGYCNEGYIMGALAAGVSGYLLKTEPLEYIVKACRGVARGEEGWFSKQVMARIVRSRRKGQNLTKREREILPLLRMTNTEIAEKLFIAESTVKKHVGEIFSKLGVTSRSGALHWAWENGFIEKN